MQKYSEVKGLSIWIFYPPIFSVSVVPIFKKNALNICIVCLDGVVPRELVRGSVPSAAPGTSKMSCYRF